MERETGMGDEVVVGSADAIPPGTGRVVELPDRELAVFNVGGSYYATDNTCLHRGGPLGEGEVVGGVVTCPWHGWEYDVATGENLGDPTARVATYEAWVEDGQVRVRL